MHSHGTFSTNVDVVSVPTVTANKNIVFHRDGEENNSLKLCRGGMWTFRTTKMTGEMFSKVKIQYGKILKIKEFTSRCFGVPGTRPLILRFRLGDTIVHLGSSWVTAMEDRYLPVN